MKTYRQIGQELHEGYREISLVGPAQWQKRIKSRVHRTFMVDFLENLIETKNKPWTIKPELKMVFDPGHKAKLDFVIRDENNVPKLHFEAKDYADIDMLKRYWIDAACVNDLHPEVINVCLSIQKAANVTDDTVSYFKRIVRFNEAVVDHLVPEANRKSTNKLCLLSYSEEQVVGFVSALGERLSQLIN